MLAGFGLEVKPLRMVSSPTVGARHTIDNILGLARNGGKEEGERATTPVNAESAGEGGSLWKLIIE